MVISRPATSRRRTARPGLTLLELLVAMGLSSMIMLMVATTVATSVRAAGGAASDQQVGRREDRGRALLSAQLAWIDLLPDTREPRGFQGQATFIEFATLVPVGTPHLRSTVRARYAALPAESGEGVRLVYMEWPALSARQRANDGPTGGAPDAMGERAAQTAEQRALQSPPSSFLTVVDRCASVQFSYLFVGPAGDRLWDLNWVDVKSLPRAVRVSWTTLEGVEGEWIVPVVATF